MCELPTHYIAFANGLNFQRGSGFFVSKFQAIDLQCDYLYTDTDVWCGKPNKTLTAGINRYEIVNPLHDADSKTQRQSNHQQPHNGLL